MTKPAITELLQHADCRYTLVVDVSKRARQLVAGAQPLVEAKDNKPLVIAIDEVNRGLIAYDRVEEEG
ncbi:MAG TPA: DNA-directed RNA polymerase subunit omega [Clostridia bacterium]|nr:DNA-directed RNA polymerase subunit omega [Clostridia bacterium]